MAASTKSNQKVTDKDIYKFAMIKGTKTKDLDHIRYINNESLGINPKHKECLGER